MLTVAIPEGDVPKVRQVSDTYDAIFRDGGWEGIYKLPYYRSPYYPLFKDVVKVLRAHGSTHVLEVGCGDGALAHMILQKTSIQYQGFDFSRVAVQLAGERTGRSNLFSVGDASKPSSYGGSYDTIVCTEVLEHVENDLGVIQNWKPGCFCVCSVPNFDAETHVRYFRNEAQVLERYRSTIEVTGIWRRKQPAISDLSWQNQVRQLRWHRYQPRELLRILGIGRFDSIGGWYLFTGRKKPESA